MIVLGQAFSPFGGTALTQLFLYAYRDDVWTQIPWQFDEVKSGLIVANEDGKLDADDQLVFMASDCGDQAPPGAWIDNANSRLYPRYEIAVSDPLDPGKQAWAYLYRAQGLASTVTQDYANYDAAQNLVMANQYLIKLLQAKVGVNRLEMNGSGVNVLDRTKIRAYVPSMHRWYTEEDVPYPSIVLVRDGRVRVVASARYGNTEQISIVGYRTRFDYDVLRLPVPAQASQARVSIDQNTEANGSIYYDANTLGGVTVDGAPDALTITPPTTWFQFSERTGTAVAMIDYQGAEVVATYYKDDQTVDPADTGDKMSWGDAGLSTVNPNATVRLTFVVYILPPLQPCIGATYRTYADHPLLAQASLQRYGTTPTQTGSPGPSATATTTRTPTQTQTPTRTRTSTITLTPTQTLTPLWTPTSTLTPTHSLTPATQHAAYLPIIVKGR